MKGFLCISWIIKTTATTLSADPEKITALAKALETRGPDGFGT